MQDKARESFQALESQFKHRGVSSSTRESVQVPRSQFKHREVKSSNGESVRVPRSRFKHRGVGSSNGESVQAPRSQFKRSLYLVSRWSSTRNSNCKTQGSNTVQATLSRKPPTDTHARQYACSFSVQTRLSFILTGITPSYLRFRSFPSRL